MQALVDGILAVPQQPIHKTWHKVDKDGNRVAGDHKRTNQGTVKPTTIQEIGGKINICIKNYNAKKAAWDYKSELIRYLNELHELNGTPNAAQREKLKKIALQDKAVKVLLDSFSEGPQVQSPPTSDPEPGPSSTEEVGQTESSMPRPEGTPRRPSPSADEPPTKKIGLAPRVLNTTEATSAAAAEEPMATTAGPSGGGDAAGNNANWTAQSFSGQVGPDGTRTFGGSRLMYTWALDMRTHNIPDYGDFVPMGHTLPWDWIPFYCTPAEWNSLPWKTHQLTIKRVGVAVTPVGKEVQFATALSTSTIASNEHVAIGLSAVGLNLRKDLPAFYTRRIKNNETGSSLITNSSTAIDYKDLRTRYWGPLNDFTVTVDPDSYKTDKQVSCAELSIRENEIVNGVLIDKFDKAVKANNKAQFGSILKDRLVKRFPLAPNMGKPVIQEVYEPKCGILNTQPHRRLIQNTVNHLIGGEANTTAQLWFNAGGANEKNKQVSAQSNVNCSRNVNIGVGVYRQIGSYHASVDKQRVIQIGGGFANSEQASGQAQPSITFGMCPIRLINLAASAPEYVNARCLWKIDYFMEISAVPFVPSYPFATNVSVDGTVFPEHMYIDYQPNTLIVPPSWNATNTAQPDYEDLDYQSQHCTRSGFIQYTYAAGSDLTEVMGQGMPTNWTASTNGLTLV